MSTGTVQIRDLWVDLREFHLRGIELDIAAGEYFVVLGPTGAGKTVLLETIAGLFEPRQGRVLIDGEDITGLPPEHRGIGFVYQDYVLFPHLDVAQNIAFGLRVGGQLPRTPPLGGMRPVLGRMARATKIFLSRIRRPTKASVDRTWYPTKSNQEKSGSRDIPHRVSEMAHLLSIHHLLHRSPGTLSGGEQQRVALARALVVQPRLLLLDEPLSALDPDTREGLQRELGQVHRELGTTTLHVTHDFEEAVALGDRIAVVHDGRIVQVGRPEGIFRRPANEFVARFVGVRNVFAGVVAEVGHNGYRIFEGGDLKLAVATDLAGPAHASIRPEDIIISTRPLRSGARNRLQGRVVDIADRGTLIYVTVRILSGHVDDRRYQVPPERSLCFTAVIMRRSLEEMALEEGMEVHIAFKASAVHVL